MEIHLHWMNFSSHWAEGVDQCRRPSQEAPKTVPPGTGLHHAQADSYPACLHTSFERRSKLVRVSSVLTLRSESLSRMGFPYAFNALMAAAPKIFALSKPVKYSSGTSI